jgi:hypothetical protein
LFVCGFVCCVVGVVGWVFFFFFLFFFFFCFVWLGGGGGGGGGGGAARGAATSGTPRAEVLLVRASASCGCMASCIQSRSSSI